MNQDELQNTVLCGDALEVLKRLPDEYVQMCVTSPPYYGLRDYGAEGQIGCEQTPLEYIDRLTEIFREVRRVLKSNGTLWLNIADSYAGSGKGVWSKSLAERPKSKQTYHSLNTDENAALPKKWDGIKEKDMIGIPWQLAFALRADGWYLRSDIIWQKPNCLPEAVKDRPSRSHRSRWSATSGRSAIGRNTQRVSAAQSRRRSFCPVPTAICRQSATSGMCGASAPIPTGVTDTSPCTPNG